MRSLSALIESLGVSPLAASVIALDTCWFIIGLAFDVHLPIMAILLAGWALAYRRRWGWAFRRVAAVVTGLASAIPVHAAFFPELIRKQLVCSLGLNGGLEVAYLCVAWSVSAYVVVRRWQPSETMKPTRPRWWLGAGLMIGLGIVVGLVTLNHSALGAHAVALAREAAQARDEGDAWVTTIEVNSGAQVQFSAVVLLANDEGLDVVRVRWVKGSE